MCNNFGKKSLSLGGTGTHQYNKVPIHEPRHDRTNKMSVRPRDILQNKQSE